jgi:hypothetical protein
MRARRIVPSTGPMVDLGAYPFLLVICVVKIVCVLLCFVVYIVPVSLTALTQPSSREYVVGWMKGMLWRIKRF